MLLSSVHPLYTHYITYKGFLFSKPIMRYRQCARIFLNIISHDISRDIINISATGFDGAVVESNTKWRKIYIDSRAESVITMLANYMQVYNRL